MSPEERRAALHAELDTLVRVTTWVAVFSAINLVLVIYLALRGSP